MQKNIKKHSPVHHYAALLLLSALTLCAQTAYAQGMLEIPQPSSYQSGIGVISGWHCNANTITIRIDGKRDVPTAYGTERADTATVCGDINNGFSLLFNYNGLTPGTHEVTAYADNTPFATSTFTVNGPGIEYLEGVSASIVMPDFPFPGQSVLLRWQQANQNFVVSGFNPDNSSLDGSYELARVVVNFANGFYFDSNSNMQATGEMQISGTQLNVVMHLTANNMSEQQSFTENFSDYSDFIFSDSGLRITIVQRNPVLILNSLVLGEAGFFSETQIWRKVQ
jgi:hypothetical protein